MARVKRDEKGNNGKKKQPVKWIDKLAGIGFENIKGQDFNDIAYITGTMTITPDEKYKHVKVKPKKVKIPITHSQKEWAKQLNIKLPQNDEVLTKSKKELTLRQFINRVNTNNTKTELINNFDNLGLTDGLNEEERKKITDTIKHLNASALVTEYAKKSIRDLISHYLTIGEDNEEDDMENLEKLELILQHIKDSTKKSWQKRDKKTGRIIGGRKYDKRTYVPKNGSKEIKNIKKKYDALKQK